ncbi:MAG TPA: hypothetical protein VME43_12950 [Bryobacteraceae bacterium]|nr:hypothetical protein [Bryobacteraceae bacterium]
MSDDHRRTGNHARRIAGAGSLWRGGGVWCVRRIARVWKTRTAGTRTVCGAVRDVNRLGRDRSVAARAQ